MYIMLYFLHIQCHFKHNVSVLHIMGIFFVTRPILHAFFSTFHFSKQWCSRFLYSLFMYCLVLSTENFTSSKSYRCFVYIYVCVCIHMVVPAPHQVFKTLLVLVPVLVAVTTLVCTNTQWLKCCWRRYASHFQTQALQRKSERLKPQGWRKVFCGSTPSWWSTCLTSSPPPVRGVHFRNNI